MKQRFFIFLVFVIFVFAGCALPPPPSSETSPVAEESNKLPSSYGPLIKNHKSIQITKGVFLRVESLNKAERFTESELQAITRVSRFAPIAFSGCDLEVLKIFVAQSWAPVVATISPVGPKHVRVVIGYDDSTQRVTLVEPTVYAPAVIGYDEFSKQWDDPQKTCLLVFSEYMGAQRIENVLKRYLPEEKLKSIRINVPNVK